MSDRSGIEKPKLVYTGDDIPLGITFRMALGEQRELTIQTHTIRDTSAEDLHALLDKVTHAGDRAGLKYRLRELELQKAQRVKEAATRMENFLETERGWQEAWTKTSRRGPFELTGQQLTMRDQAYKMRDDLQRMITDVDAEIEKVKSQMAGK